eukprot:m.54978 g.54978  ORF g.54978 m.54978 type:complete len:619 (-) comp7572_c0_seq1:151-2007(-)
MDVRELTDKVIYTCRAEWDAFLDRASENGAVKLVLIVDPALTTRVDQAAGGFSHLQSKGVTKVYPLSRGLRLDARQGHKNVFVLSTETTAATEMAAHELETAGHERRKAVVGFLPRHNLECAAVLEMGGVAGKVIVDTIPLHATPFAPDALVMPTPDFFHGCFGDTVGGTHGSGHCGIVSEALTWLSSIVGPVPQWHAVGGCAAQVAGSMAASATPSGTTTQAPFDGAVVIDRVVDLVSPMCNQLTYAGMVDETWGTDLGTAQFGSDVVEAATEGKPVRVALYRGVGEPDAIYESVKDRNFAEVGRELSLHAKTLGASYDERHGVTELADLKKFVSKLGSLKAKHRSLQTHINVSHALLNRRSNDAFHDLLELQLQIVGSGTALSGSASSALDAVLERIYRQEPLIPVLQLVCLMATAQLPIRARDWDTVLTAFYQSYGYAHLATTARLCASGLLRPAAGGSTKADSRASTASVDGVAAAATAVPTEYKFKTLRKRLGLVIPASSGAATDESDDLYQAHYGYVPLLSAVIDRVAGSGADAEDIRKMMAPTSLARFGRGGHPAGSTNGYWLVVVLGGITCAELAVLRQLGRRNGRKYLVLTTGLCTAERLLRGAMRIDG